MLAEFALLSVCSWMTFRRPIGPPSAVTPLYSDDREQEGGGEGEGEGTLRGELLPRILEEELLGGESQGPERLSFLRFVCQVLQLEDLYSSRRTPLLTAVEVRQRKTTSSAREKERDTASSSGDWSKERRWMTRMRFTNASSSGTTSSSSGMRTRSDSLEGARGRYGITTMRPFSHDSGDGVLIDSSGRVKPLVSDGD